MLKNWRLFEIQTFCCSIREHFILKNHVTKKVRISDVPVWRWNGLSLDPHFNTCLLILLPKTCTRIWLVFLMIFYSCPILLSSLPPGGPYPISSSRVYDVIIVIGPIFGALFPSDGFLDSTTAFQFVGCVNNPIFRRLWSDLKCKFILSRLKKSWVLNRTWVPTDKIFTKQALYHSLMI